MVIDNIKLIRDMMRDLRPESLVLEMCEDRYQRWLADVIAHPNYDSTISTVHKILDKNPDKLVDFDQIAIEDSNMEYLIGLDYCSYRIPCKAVLGDRSYKLTKKRYESKIQMLDVYKEAIEINTGASMKRQKKSTSKSQKSIFDLTEQST